MLRIHVVRDGGHAYYVDDLVPGRAEGTLVAGEEPGRWWGAGPSSMGQSGRVDGRPFAEVLAGRDPVSGVAIGAPRARHRVSAYDLTFCAPKSVSLVHLLAPREMADESGAAHRAAVDEALGYLERSAVGVRRTRSGVVTRMPAAGMVAGVFVHRTSRALDPHLHSHAVVANLAQGVDGHWSALDSRRMFSHAQSAQAVYHARLRLELGERLGGVCEVDASGLSDLVGVDRALRRLFSQRAASMDEYRHRRAAGRGLSRSSRVVFHATRPEKDRTRTVDALRAEWRERAATFGFDLGALTTVVGRRPEIGEGGSRVDRRRVGAALDRLAQEGRSLAQRDLVTVVASASTVGASVGEIEAMARGLIEAAGGSTGTWRASGQGSVGPGPAGDERWPAAAMARALDQSGRRVSRWRALEPSASADAVSDHRIARLPRDVRRIEMDRRPQGAWQLGR